MAVVAADIAHRGTSGSIDRDGNRNYSIEYNVEVDDYTDGPVTILEYFRVTPGLPWLNDSYAFAGDSDIASYCSTIAPEKKQGSQTEWLVRISYSQLTPRSDENGDPVSDPLDVGRSFAFGFSTRQQPLHIGTWNGTYYIDPSNAAQPEPPNAGFYGGMSPPRDLAPVNSAGDVFDPPLLEDVSDLVFSCAINLGGFNADVARQYKDAVNQDDLQLDLSGTIFNTIFHVYKYQMKCVNIGATFTASSFTDTNGLSVTRFYWDTQYEFHIREGQQFANVYPKGWTEWVVDRGYNRSARPGDPDGKGGMYGATQPGQPLVTRILGEDDNPVSEPSLLDGQGQPLTVSSPRYQEFLPRKLVDFTTLPVGFTSWTPP